MNLEKELSDINNRISKKETNFWWASDLYYDAKQKYFSADKKELTDKCAELAASIYFFFVAKTKDYCWELANGKYAPRSESLNKLEANLEEISKNVEQASRAFPHLFKENMSCENIKIGVEKAKELVSLEREFAIIIDKELDLDRSNFTWTKIKEIWEEAKQKASISRPEKWMSEAAEAAKWNIYGKIIEGAWELVEEINKGGDKLPPNAYPSTAEELNFLQEIADEFPQLLVWGEKTHDPDEMKEQEGRIQKAKEDNEKLKSFIQQERKKHGYSFQPTHQPNPQEEKKIQDQQKEIDYLKKQLTKLQNQIEELKSQINPENNSTNQEIQQKIATLQNQKEQVQKTLKQKQSQQERIQQQANTQPSEKGFNWLYVVIPGSVLLVVMGIIIAYLVRKRNKKE